MGARVRVPVCVHVRMRACETGLYEMKTLVIAEKPSVAQDIVRALTPIAGKFEKHEDHFESETYVVTSAVGHLVEIQAPEKFDVKRGKWRLCPFARHSALLRLEACRQDQNPAERRGQAGQAQRRGRLGERL